MLALSQNTLVRTGRQLACMQRPQCACTRPETCSKLVYCLRPCQSVLAHQFPPFAHHPCILRVSSHSTHVHIYACPATQLSNLWCCAAVLTDASSVRDSSSLLLCVKPPACEISCQCKESMAVAAASRVVMWPSIDAFQREPVGGLAGVQQISNAPRWLCNTTASLHYIISK